MNIAAHRLSSKEFGHLSTEISFNIASWRALGVEILQIKAPDGEPDEITVSRITRILRSLKKKEFIKLFVTREEFENESAAAEYLLNKHPQLSDVLKSDTEEYFIIKL